MDQAQATLTLQPGHFYRSRAGDVWCCYRVDLGKEDQSKADCVSASPGGRLEYFYLDGRYDREGKREHTLIKEVAADGSPLQPPLDLNTWRDLALRIAVEHGFTDASIGEDLMLMVTELAEAMEDHRAGRRPDDMFFLVTTADGHMRKVHDAVSAVRLEGMRLDHQNGCGPEVLSAKPCGIPSELADVLIRVFHFCGKHKIDIRQAVAAKMAFNATRPFKHGGKTL